MQTAHLARWVLWIGLACGPLPGWSAPIANGAAAAAFVRDCRSDAARNAGSRVPDRCDDRTGNFGNTLVESTQDLRPGGLSARSLSSHHLGRDGALISGGAVDASGAAGTLTLKQAAASGSPYARVSGHTVALQSFYFDGTGPTTRTIRNELDFSASHLGTVDAFRNATTSPASIVQAAVRVFSLAAPTFEATPLGVGFGMFNSFARDNGLDYREESFWIDQNIVSEELVVDFDFTMEAGRWYFVESWLGLWAKFGAQVDATHTFTSTLGIIDANTGQFSASLLGLTPSPASVPEAPTALLIAGVLLLLLRARAAPARPAPAARAPARRRCSR